MEEKLKQHISEVIKVVLFGPESTGKTTLSRQLAKHYNTSWVPEYAREYLQKKWDNENKTCEVEDIIPIAIGQIKIENELTKKTKKLLICDTDLLETKVYSEQFYNGYVDKELVKASKENNYDLYLLTYIDTPWKPDDLRDRPNQRKEMFNAFEKALLENNKNYILLKGDEQTRLKKAISVIDKIISIKHL